MSGHSKWATIRHKKGAADAKRGKVFSKLSKELLVVARSGGGNPDLNPTLRTLIQKCKGVNMPNDNIERAIKKGTGEIDGITYDEVVYEGYANGGVGLVVKCLTDNKNRAAAEIRHIFSKHGSAFAGQGAVTRGFERKGQLFVEQSATDEDTLMNVVLEAGADDMQPDGDQFEILCDPSNFQAVVDALAAAEIATVSAEITLVPTTYMPVTDKAIAKSVMKFVGDLEDNDDVQDVYHNMDVDDAIMSELEAES